MPRLHDDQFENLVMVSVNACYRRLGRDMRECLLSHMGECLLSHMGECLLSADGWYAYAADACYAYAYALEAWI